MTDKESLNRLMAEAMMLVDKLTDTPGPDGDYYDIGVLMYKDRTLCFISETHRYAVRIECAGIPSAAAPKAICLAVEAALKEASD